MERQANLQLELFTQSKDSGDLRSRGPNKSFLAYIRNYERVILTVIAMITTSIISFTLGVEKGKRLTMLKDNSSPTMGFTIQHPSTTTIIKRELSEDKLKDTPSPKGEAGRYIIQKEETIKKSVPLEKESYIIQLASYKMKIHAQREAGLLRKTGLSPLVLSKGDYIVLCVGNFSNKVAAQSLLPELKRRYKGCFIRRL